MPKTTKKCPYTGEEPSPKGRGFCARNMPLNIVMFGTDGHPWIVTKVLGGVKRWVRCKTTKQKTRRTASKKSSTTRRKKTSPSRKSRSTKRKNRSSTRKSKSPSRRIKSVKRRATTKRY